MSQASLIDSSSVLQIVSPPCFWPLLHPALSSTWTQSRCMTAGRCRKQRRELSRLRWKMCWLYKSLHVLASAPQPHLNCWLARVRSSEMSWLVCLKYLEVPRCTMRGRTLCKDCPSCVWATIRWVWQTPKRILQSCTSTASFLVKMNSSCRIIVFRVSRSTSGFFWSASFLAWEMHGICITWICGSQSLLWGTVDSRP